MDDLETLKKEREKWITRIFLLSLEIIFIFLIPALTAVFFAKKVGGDNSSFIYLSIAFIFSWSIVIIRYIRVSKKMREIDSKIKKENNKEKKSS